MQTVHTHCASVHQVAKLVVALLMVTGVTAGLAESIGSLPPGLWLTSPVGWLPRTGISSGTLRSVIEYGLPLLFFSIEQQTVRYCGSIKKQNSAKRTAHKISVIVPCACAVTVYRWKYSNVWKLKTHLFGQDEHHHSVGRVQWQTRACTKANRAVTCDRSRSRRCVKSPKNNNKR